ncbi:hypothetical protein MICAC_5510023 [Microcystis aeruginosa PCC 9443]|uniref:Uncharacterized protein n=1 Tax=Microcystis aeruginosa PCC 9443 TaxID=1160281 RepID=I4G8J9_MICAE|nr:hypothetical protein MICAC_5510023 [Microcystis aeruginosa PCC 9443]
MIDSDPNSTHKGDRDEEKKFYLGNRLSQFCHLICLVRE